MPHTGFAPGRVNIIGEHTDYNDGLALPFSITLGVSVRATPMQGDRIEAEALDIGERDSFAITAPARISGWRAFVRGTVAELRRAGYDVGGMRLQITGTLPRGAGLSSSAALAVALCMALVGASDPPVERMALVRLCSLVENEWVGAQTGLLDQIAALYGDSSHALRIDFRTLDITAVPLHLGGWQLVTIDSGETRSLAASGYNQRRAECAEALGILGLSSMRDARIDDLTRLPHPLDLRVRHVIEENARVDAVVGALERGDLAAVGALLDESHRSLRDLYEASTPGVEAAVARVSAAGAVGARMMGGGWGGRVLALFPPGSVLPAEAIPVRPGPGAHLDPS